MRQYLVCTSRYPTEIATFEKGKGKRKVRKRIGQLDRRKVLSNSINKKLEELGEGWSVKSISTSLNMLGDMVFVVLFEKP